MVFGLLILVAGIAVGAAAYLQHPKFGKLPEGGRLERIEQSPHFKDGEFGNPAGFDPSIGDITYYAPWGNLAIFHKDFRYSEGLVHLGRIEDGIDALKVRGALKVTIEAIDK